MMKRAGKSIFVAASLLIVVGAVVIILVRLREGSESHAETVLVNREYKISRGTSICIEAEDADSLKAPMRVLEEADASGGKCVEIPEGAGKPPEVQCRAVYQLTIETPGEYIFWGRVWWDDSCCNSLALVMDNGSTFTFGQDATYKHWHWVRGPTYTLTQGVHNLEVLNREDGIRLDQVFLTQDKEYIPVGSESSWD